MENITEIQRSYIVADHDRRMHYSKIGCVLSLIALPAGSSVDYFMYPESLGFLFGFRAIFTVLIGSILLLHFTNFGQKHIKILTISYVMVLQLALCTIIFLQDGVNSTYYVSLVIVILAAGILLPISIQEILFLVLSSLVLYLIACFRHSDVALQNNLIFNNVYFIVLTGAVSSTAVFFNARSRYEEFRLNYELDERNEELEGALKQLKDAESQLVQSEKLRGLGHMAAGLLHEINNPVNYTTMALQLLQREQVIQDDPDLKETFDDINDGINRIQEIISRSARFRHTGTNGPAKAICFFRCLEARASVYRP